MHIEDIHLVYIHYNIYILCIYILCMYIYIYVCIIYIYIYVCEHTYICVCGVNLQQKAVAFSASPGPKKTDSTQESVPWPENPPGVHHLYPLVMSK